MQTNLIRKLGTYGNRDGLDAAHYKGSKPRAENKSHQLTDEADLKLKMTPLLPTPDYYLHNLITMTSSESKKALEKSYQRAL